MRTDNHKEATMGIFSGIFGKECPKCGSTVRRNSRFCPKCGGGAPDAWWKCPHCHKWVGIESKFCWNCKAELHPDERGALAGRMWQRRAGLFAQRIEVDDTWKLIEKRMMDILHIQEGTTAILLEGGVYRGILPPGRHTLDSLLRSLKEWGDPAPRTVVLVDSGDIVLPVQVSGLRSKEELPLEMTAELLFRFDAAGAIPFLANLLKERTELTYDDLRAAFSMEGGYAAKNLCNATGIESLVKDPQRRLALEDELRRTWAESLARLGLQLQRVTAVEFKGAEYEQLRKSYGELEVKRREIEYRQRLVETLNDDEMWNAKTENEKQEYLDQLAQERGISVMQREQEMAILQKVLAQEMTLKEAALKFQVIQEQIDNQYRLDRQAGAAKWDLDLQKLLQEQERVARTNDFARDEAKRNQEHGLDAKARENQAGRDERAKDVDAKTTVEAKNDAYERDRMVQDVKAEDEALRVKMEREMDEAKKALELRGQKNAVDNADLAEKNAIEAKRLKDVADVYANRTLEELMMVTTDPDQRQRLVELKRLQEQKGLSQDQLLALAAANGSEAAAKALAEARRISVDEMRQMLQREHDQKQKTMDEAAARLERVMQVAMQTTAQAAQAAARGVSIAPLGALCSYQVPYGSPRCTSCPNQPDCSYKTR